MILYQLFCLEMLAFLAEFFLNFVVDFLYMIGYSVKGLTYKALVKHTKKNIATDVITAK